MKKYSKNTSIGRVKLSINDLSELVTLLNGKFPLERKEDFEIKATISDLIISENDLDNFLKHTELSKTLDNIHISRVEYVKYSHTNVDGVDNEKADYFKPTDGQTEFILPNTPSGKIHVFVNGKEEDSYNISGNSLTFIPSGAGYQLASTDLVKISYLKPRKIDKSIYLTLNNSSNNIQVNGFDQTWVLGKNKQLIDYLKTKRPFLGFISKTAALVLSGSTFAIIMIIILQMIKDLKALNPLFILSILPLSILCYSLWKVKNTNIIINETKSFWEKNGTVILIILTFLTLIAIIVQIFITK